MIKAGVIGSPISHSLSPKLHGYWLKKYNIDGEYKAYDVAPEDLEKFIREMPEKGFAGCNVTIPHKERVFEMLQLMGENDAIANMMLAVNTIIVKDGNLLGTNTDAYGFAQNIIPHIKNKDKAVVLGAGGAANPIWNALIGMGFKEVVITNRTKENIALKEPMIKNMVARVEGAFYTIYEWKNWDAMFTDCDLLVNATSLGMVGQPPLDIDLSLLPKEALVTDIVYNPLITPLLAAAQARANPIVDGLGMLLHQAAPGFEAWFGQKPEVTQELRAAVLA